MTKEIHFVCTNCGQLANTLTCLKKYGEYPKKIQFTVSTYHMGTCEVCGKETDIVEARDFFYPDFSLIQKHINNWQEIDEEKQDELIERIDEHISNLINNI